MGINPAFNFICNRLRTYSKMLTLPIGHPWPTKASLTSCQAHAIFFNGLKFRVEFVPFKVSISDTFMPQNVFPLLVISDLLHLLFHRKTYARHYCQSQNSHFPPQAFP